MMAGWNQRRRLIVATTRKHRQPPVPARPDSDAWEVIIECTDDMIEGELLSCAGLGERQWPEDVAEMHNFHLDVASDCEWLSFEVESWDGGPGSCGGGYIVSTCDEEEAKRDLRVRCREFVRERRWECRDSCTR